MSLPIITLAAEEGASLSSGSLRLYGYSSGGEVVGCVDLYSYDPVNRRCAVGIMVATDKRRQGYALAMLLELERMAAGLFHLHQLYADIAASNTASVHLFDKAGYRQCGQFKDWLNVNDKYVDSIRVQLVL